MGLPKCNHVVTAVTELESVTILRNAFPVLLKKNPQPKTDQKRPRNIFLMAAG